MEHDSGPPGPSRSPSAWRRTIGALLRAAREDRGMRLVDVAVRARLSPQYLSEVERGLKEPSSEVLAAITAALGLTLVDLAQGIVDALDAPVRRSAVLSLTSRTVPRHATPVPRATTLLAA
ncbi:helix-turn-helix domain-containing protein [Cellulomonas dongxiuzhuiae]|uniref:Helix-turn-helix transcriptional regulator n=1 Tax=Cellulomonas dongxiuzhuiae TaxID=2819979 RepID=A0ABX8GGS8_9CELL|nr:helix-turn-helix transcriptional regulator [Cellulomonas dongxiuzhuiae]MBO3087009.1 helix-turn-helix transcriptional regulator [Cellulomonas dongxiuzhuiae]MBO3093633.1 helix-turn-helix transcriptional regulator [Cellulomonas dongxiuzhuiae]QWC14749.1 helix-turn-helix transcriptional regulator [Cellulomonas dongxiuzhuiae]